MQHALSILENEKARAQPQSETALHDKAPSAGLKDLSASAAKPPPRHPILKKPRGPSTSGPRPTARFVSPHVSGDEDDQDGSSPSSTSTITPALEMKSSNPSPPKKKVPTKKFVASKTAGRRRPALPRKTSSQSSGISDQGSRDATALAYSRFSDGSLGSVSPVAEAATAHETSEQETKPRLSAKAAGKRPLVPRTPAIEKRCALPQEAAETATIQTPKSTAQSFTTIKSSPIVPSNQSQEERLMRPHSSIDLSGPSSRKTKAREPRSPLENVPDSSAIVASVPMVHSHSHSGYMRANSDRVGRATTSGLFTGATSSTTNVAAQGVIIDQSGSFSSGPTPGFFERDDLGSRSESFSSSLLESRLVPTPPSTSASVPLGRTRSQLTLLLEREKEARASGRPRPKG